VQSGDSSPGSERIQGPTVSAPVLGAPPRERVRGDAVVKTQSASGRAAYVVDVRRLVPFVFARIVAKARGVRGPESSFEHWPVVVLISVYVGWFCFLSMKMYYGYGYPPFDLAIFDQGLWLLTHFHTPFVTVMGRNLFGDHTSFILFLVAPFYRLFPEPQGILVLQTLAMAGAAMPIYLLSRKLTKNTVIATLLVATFLLNPALEQGNLQQFHPEAFQVLFISWAIYAAVESRSVLLIVMVALALMVKEDAAILVIPLGVWVLARRDRRLGLGIIAGAVAWASLALGVIIPSLLGKSSLYASDVPFGGVGGFLRTLIRDPGQMINYLRTDGRPYYVWQMGFTTGWAFLFSPEIAAIGVIVVAENVVSTLPYMHQLPYQFSMVLAPIMVMGTAWAIAAQKSVRRRNLVTALTVTCALWSCVLWGFTPFSNNSVTATWDPASSTVRELAALEKQIPPDAVVSAWWPLASHLDHRVQIYLWPTPFKTGNYGLFYNTDGRRLPVADKVQYLVLPSPLTEADAASVFATISSEYRLVDTGGGVALYRKVGS
jgi:uncharacterized membrane protein